MAHDASQASDSEVEDARLWAMDTDRFMDSTTFSTVMSAQYRGHAPIAPVEAAEHEPEPVVAIQYTNEYRLVMNLVRGIIASREVSPRFLYALSTGLRHCPANYALWKHRRDVLMNASSFANACHTVSVKPWLWHPHIEPPKAADLKLMPQAKRAELWKDYENRARALKPYPFPPHLDGKLECDQPKSSQADTTEFPVRSALEEAEVCWAPSLWCLPVWPTGAPLAPYEILLSSADLPHISTSPAGSPDVDAPVLRVYDPWHALAWELRTTRYTAVTIGKSFQTWNHRKELLITAAARTARDAPFIGCVLSSHGSIASTRDDVPSLRITFNDFDERTLTRYVLHNVDAKNYHAWSHRAWFVTFTGLLDTAAGFQQELEETASLIAVDRFNNSAWSHRILVSRHMIFGQLFPQAPPEAGDDPKRWNAFPSYFPLPWVQNPRAPQATRELPDDEFLVAFEAMRAMVWREIDFCLREFREEPRNEAPATYAVGLLRVLEDAVDRRRSSQSISIDVLQNSVIGMYEQIDERLGSIDVLQFARDLWNAGHTNTNSQTSVDTDVYAPGSTELLRSIPVTLHRDATRWFAAYRYVTLMRRWNLADGEEGRLLESKKKFLVDTAESISRIDPIRRKYWHREMARAASL